ncbi:hypothetical protein ABPG75_012009 [Micractinium tetrahymenae]
MPGPPPICALPGDLLARILSLLDPLRELLRSVNLDTHQADGTTNAQAQRSLARLRSFSCWLLRRAAPHVRRLQLRIGTPYGDERAATRFEAEVLGLLLGCGAAAPQLEEVHLNLQFLHLALPACLAPALHNLRVLEVEIEEGGLTLEVPLTAMSRLERLRLSATEGSGLELAPEASLPASLTSLRLGSFGWYSAAEEVPTFLPQVTCLPRLSRLRLDSTPFTPERFHALTALAGSLRSLSLRWPSFLPGPQTFRSLSCLTALDLESFSVAEDDVEDVFNPLEAALSELPQLQQLEVHFGDCGYDIALPRLPPALAGMTSLHSLWCDLEAQDRALPPGAWQHSLRRLLLPGDIYLLNSSGIAAMPLRLLGVLHPYHSALHYTLMQLLEDICTLRHLLFETSWGADDPGPPLFLRVPPAAQQRNPPLCITTHVRIFEQSFDYIDSLEC